MKQGGPAVAWEPSSTLGLTKSRQHAYTSTCRKGTVLSNMVKEVVQGSQHPTLPLYDKESGKQMITAVPWRPRHCLLDGLKETRDRSKALAAPLGSYYNLKKQVIGEGSTSQPLAGIQRKPSLEKSNSIKEKTSTVWHFWVTHHHAGHSRYHICEWSCSTHIQTPSSAC